MSFGPITAALLGTVGSLFNKPKASPYEKVMAQLTNMQAGSYRQYMPQLLQMLYGQAKGKSSPYLQAMETSQLANTQRDFGSLLAQAGQAYAGRGMGRSNVASGGLNQIAERTARNMANIRMNRLGAEEARVQDALQTLLSAISGQGSSAASNSYNLAQSFGERNTTYNDRLIDSLAKLGEAIANYKKPEKNPKENSTTRPS